MRTRSTAVFDHGNSEVELGSSVLVAHARVHSASALFAHVVREQPIDSRLRVATDQVVLAEVGHVEHSDSVARREALVPDDVMMLREAKSVVLSELVEVCVVLVLLVVVASVEVVLQRRHSAPTRVEPAWPLEAVSLLEMAACLWRNENNCVIQ